MSRSGSDMKVKGSRSRSQQSTRSKQVGSWPSTEGHSCYNWPDLGVTVKESYHGVFESAYQLSALYCMVLSV